MNILLAVSMVFTIVGFVFVFRGYKFARAGSYEAYKMYTYGFLALGGGDLMSAFREGFANPDYVELILSILFIGFAYKEWKNYIGR